MQDSVKLVEQLKKIHEISRTDEIVLPLDIFQNRKLGMLEASVVYLKEELGLPNRKIAKLLNRDNRTIWASYDKAKRKLK